MSNNIIPYSPNSLYSPSEERAIVAIKTKQITACMPSEIQTKLNSAVSSAGLFCGQPLNGDDLWVIVEQITVWLKDKKRHFGIEEVCLAIDLGSKREFGEAPTVPAVSGTTIINWINLYTEKTRKEALFKKRHEDEKAEYIEKKKKDYEVLKAFENRICEIFEEFCAGLDLNCLTDIDKECYFNHMAKKGYIDNTILTDEDQIMIEDIVKNRLAEEKKALEESYKGKDKWEIMSLKEHYEKAFISPVCLMKSMAFGFVLTAFKAKGVNIRQLFNK